MARERMGAAIALLSVATFVYGCRGSGPTGFNLILVSVDTLRADHLSSYEDSSHKTPHMDRLASEGVLYENVSTVAPTTLPAHASLFTGLTPVAHGVRDNVGFYLGDGTTTLAEHLKSQGYETAAFIGAFVLDSRFGLDRGFDRYDDDVESGTDDGVGSGFVAQRRGAEVLESALEWLGSRGGTNRPFFAFIHFYEPHTPYEGGYRAEVAQVDSLVGQLLSWLEARGLDERTVVALTSDHGESLGEHGEETHGLFLYQSTLRIPFLLRYPGAPAGSRISTPTSITAVPSVLLETLRLPPMPGRRPAAEQPLYAESFVSRLHYGWSELRSVTRWPHKLVSAPKPELYDLEKDPAETTNRIEELKDVAGALRAELEPMAGPPVSPQSVDGETLEKLESLGYTSSEAHSEGELPDPKDRIEIYRLLNDPALQSLGPEDGAAFEKALADLKHALAREPLIPRTYSLYGELLIEAGRAEEAAEVFQSFATVAPGSFDAHYGLGVARKMLGRADAAIEALSKAVEIDPRNTKSYLRLSEVDRDAAEGWLRRGIAVHKDRVLVDRLAEVLLQSSEPAKRAEARSLLEGLAAKSPHDALAAYNLGQLLLVEGQSERALTALERASALAPSDPDIHQALGSALGLSGRREEAVESFRRAVELAPCFAAAHANLGAAYAELNRLPEAAAALEKAVSCDPQYAAGFKNLAAIRYQMGNLEGAITAMREAVKASPGDRELQRSLQELLHFRARQDRLQGR
jgi:arylsulfatase A-like enzyme/tetratricopeptide (TPR) repeat protein